jgi:hypothetical protein
MKSIKFDRRTVNLGLAAMLAARGFSTVAAAQTQEENFSDAVVRIGARSRSNLAKPKRDRWGGSLTPLWMEADDGPTNSAASPGRKVKRA